MMWVRYGLLCVFAVLVARRRGVRIALRSDRPWLQLVRSLVAVECDRRLVERHVDAPARVHIR